MKREIKFRGKNYDGMWMYGYLMPIKSPIHLDCKYGISVSPSALKSVDRILYEVETNTIGQFTGLKDKNGNDIYEGDIVYSEFADGSNCMFLVGWNNKLSCFGVMDGYNYRSKQLGYDFPEFDNHLFIEVLKNSKIFKIIGNIHDNKELLTEKRKCYESY